ncbi:MAG: hypothetical protein R2932_50395 [Caldilineaceae bacterium]
MTKLSLDPIRVDQELVAAPIEVHGYQVEPVARLTGWQLVAPPSTPGEQRIAGGGAWLRLTPTAIRVAQDGQSTRVIAIVMSRLTTAAANPTVAFGTAFTRLSTQWWGASILVNHPTMIVIIAVE